ncbi:Dehydrodolichyl diphosphate synthase complex subunit DHDDS [Paragonimus heterotremus]|uniref:Alkyl transferase n=1 Tax=Paragonimus heterotremus TaxID=100268 RepID=A0A8J4WGV2_9TREM|nr:Dehydrodolichyl diphosphate synthase complex subunit DHDDS [Paragonimus heterotremus]
MSWTYPDFQYSVLQRLCMYLIKYGPIPEHIAIIMDGNRRFAATNHMKTSDGHLQGFSKLSETLRWCKDLGVKELTVFAFSVENFNRSSEEVSFLLQLAADKLSELLEKIEELCADGICIRLIGNLSTLPTRIQRLGSELMLKTRHNTNSILNVCMAYSSQDELTESVEHIRVGVRDRLIYPSDISPELLSGCLYTRFSRPLDLLIRTSGEVRLSDFLLWQSASSGTVHKFVESYWPDFSFWNFLFVILHFQLAALHISRLTGSVQSSEHLKSALDKTTFNSQRGRRIRRFLDRLDCEYWGAIEKRALLLNCLPTTDSRSTQRSIGDSLLS